MTIPSGAETPRPFLPGKDFDLSKRFYDALGFKKTLDGDDVAIYEIGTGGFLLQKFYVKDWAENFMMQLMVDGLRIAYMSDPSGALWHIAQRRPGVAHD